MLHEEVIVQYHGIQTSDLTKNSIFTLMEEIHKEGPATGTVRAAFHKEGAMYRGTVHLHSKAGSFFTAAAHENLMQVAERVLLQMRKQIKKWQTKSTSGASMSETKATSSEKPGAEINSVSTISHLKEV